MAILGRKSLKSSRLRMRQIDNAFARCAQVILIAYFLFFLTCWLSYRESFRIDAVNISGAQTVSAERVAVIARQFLSQKLLWKIDRNNAVFYPKKSLTEELYAFDSHIKNVEMHVEQKKNLQIRITEFTPAYLWCGGGDSPSATSTNDCFLSDSKGVVYAQSPQYSGYPFLVFYTDIAGSEEQGTPIGLSVLPNQELSKVLVMITELGKNNISVSRIDQTDEHDYVLHVNQPWVLQWSSENDAVKSVANLMLLLSDLAGKSPAGALPVSIDLRFGNKIFYKYK